MCNEAIKNEIKKSATVECGVKSKQLSMAWRSARADTAD